MLKSFVVEYDLCLNSFSLNEHGDVQESAGIEDKFNTTENVTKMAELLEEQDEPPHVLGIPITPLLLNSLIGYVVSVAGTVILYALGADG